MEPLLLIFLTIVLTAVLMQTLPNWLHDWVNEKCEKLRRERDDDPNVESEANAMYEIFANEAKRIGPKGEDAIAVYYRTLVCVIRSRRKVGPIPKLEDFDD